MINLEWPAGLTSKLTVPSVKTLVRSKVDSSRKQPAEMAASSTVCSGGDGNLEQVMRSSVVDQKRNGCEGPGRGAWPSGSWGAGARGRSTLAAKFVLRGTGGEGGTRGPRPRLQGEWPITWTLQQAKDAQRQWIDRHQIWSRPRAANRGDRGAPIGPRCPQRPRFGSRAEDDAGGRISGHANLKSGPQGTRRKPIHWVRLTNYGDSR